MLIAEADFPFLEFLWAMIFFFAWVAWIWIVITVFIDLFRRHDIGGWGKAGWVVFVIVIPFLGVLVYLIAQHDGLRDRLEHTTRRRLGERDREGQGAARLRGDHPGGVRLDQDHGAFLEGGPRSRRAVGVVPAHLRPPASCSALVTLEWQRWQSGSSPSRL